MRKTPLFLTSALLALIFCAQDAAAKDVRFTIEGSIYNGCSKADYGCSYTDTNGNAYTCSFDTPKCEAISLQCGNAVCEVDAIVNPDGDSFEITKVKSIKIVKKL